MKVPFFRLSFNDDEKKEVQSALDKGWITSGPKVKEFEELIKEATGAKYAAAVSSATSGLNLVWETLGLTIDDEIITTPYTMVSTIEAIIHAGGRPVLADIEPGHMNINPLLIKKAITQKTKAICSVDMAGYPCDYDRLTRISEEHDLFLLNDAAHSLGAKYHGKPIGSIADATVFSFYSTKNITTGEGGMVVSDSEKTIEKVRHLALHGMTSSGWKRHQGGGWKYDITDLGYKSNLSDLSAALGVGQMKRFDKIQAKRHELAERYLENLAGLTDYIDLPSVDEKNIHAWHLFIIKIIFSRWSINRDQLIDELENAGVGCGVHFIPIYHFSYFKNLFNYQQSDFLNCENVFNSAITLPLYPDLTLEEVDFVCQTIKNMVGKFGVYNNISL